MTESWVAIDACTLPTVEQPLRVAEFDALCAEYVVAVERRSPTTVVMELKGEPTLYRRVRDLAERENACCSFFSFAISAAQPEVQASALRLEIRVPANRTDVLDALADRADRLRSHS